MKNIKIEVGQEIYVKGKYNYTLGEMVKIAKVGKKYFYISDDVRFFKDTLRHDNGKYSPNISIWESEKCYHEQIQNQAMWNIFYNKVRNCYNMPTSLNHDIIKKAYDLLFESEGLEDNEKN